MECCQKFRDQGQDERQCMKNETKVRGLKLKHKLFGDQAQNFLGN
uniref:Uncharacterized protein n=1 Tax=Rhizophora mucronata TaxID=61149 RepID=A0A2P2NQ90_RHIMU